MKLVTWSCSPDYIANKNTYRKAKAMLQNLCLGLMDLSPSQMSSYLLCIHNCNAKCTQNIPQLPYILTQTICTKQCEPISVLNPKAAWHSSHGQGRRVVHQLHHK